MSAGKADITERDMALERNSVLREMWDKADCAIDPQTGRRVR